MDQYPKFRERKSVHQNAYKTYQVWVDEEGKVASFHEIKGVTPSQFRTEEFFLKYIDDLIEHAFRFQ